MYKVGLKYEVSGNSKDPKNCKEPEYLTNVKRTMKEGIRPGRSHMMKTSQTTIRKMDFVLVA